MALLPLSQERPPARTDEGRDGNAHGGGPFAGFLHVARAPRPRAVAALYLSHTLAFGGLTVPLVVLALDRLDHPRLARMLVAGVLAVSVHARMDAIDRDDGARPEQLEALLQDPILGALPTFELERVAVGAQMLSVAPGEVVINQGALGDRYSVIRDRRRRGHDAWPAGAPEGRPGLRRDGPRHRRAYQPRDRGSGPARTRLAGHRPAYRTRAS